MAVVMMVDDDDCSYGGTVTMKTLYFPCRCSCCCCYGSRVVQSHAYRQWLEAVVVQRGQRRVLWHTPLCDIHKPFQGETRIAFPTIGVRDFLLFLQLCLPLIFASILRNESKPGSTSITLMLERFDRCGDGGGSGSFFNVKVDT